MFVTFGARDQDRIRTKERGDGQRKDNYKTALSGSPRKSDGVDETGDVNQTLSGLHTGLPETVDTR